MQQVEISSVDFSSSGHDTQRVINDQSTTGLRDHHPESRTCQNRSQAQFDSEQGLSLRDVRLNSDDVGLN